MWRESERERERKIGEKDGSSLFLVRGNGTVVATRDGANGSSPALGKEDMALVGKGEEDPETPDGLCDDVEDAKCQHLVIDRHLARALGEGPHDGVGGPDDDEGEGDLVEVVADLWRAEEGVAACRRDQLEDNVEEGEAAECVQTPAEAQRRVQGTDEARDNHKDVGTDDDEGLGLGQASNERQVEEQEAILIKVFSPCAKPLFNSTAHSRRGQEPINVTRVKDLAGRGAVVWVRVNERLSDA